jgi:lipopolysaccharide heptosyltransferase II
MNRVLISGYTGLGNFILKTPMIKKIKGLYPDCKIDIITGNSFGTEFVLKGSDLINHIFILKERSSFLEKFNFFINLKKENYDTIFLAFDANSKFLFFGSYLANIKTRIVHVNLRSKIKTLFFLCMPNSLVVPLLQGRHEIDLNYDLLESYINKPMDRGYQTFLNNTKDKFILNKFKLKENKYIVLQVGAANGAKSSKKWSIKNFEHLINELNINHSEYHIVTVGDECDYENDIKNLENKKLNFINTAGLTTIDEVANILYYSKVVVANDSGIMHIANALNSNLIALYGPTDYTRTKPLGKNTTILYSKSDCFCQMYNFTGNESELLKLYPNCMDNIKVIDVFKNIEKVINDK